MTWKKLDDAAEQYAAGCYQVRALEEVTLHLQQNRPVAVSTVVYSDCGWFSGDGKIRLHTPDQRLVGSHCILIVAKNPRGYRFANSWGTGWGDHGFDEMSEETARAILHCDGAWAIEM
jgi:hypothetical protein